MHGEYKSSGTPPDSYVEPTFYMKLPTWAGPATMNILTVIPCTIDLILSLSKLEALISPNAITKG